MSRSLPKSLGSLSNLKVLDISSNYLEGIVSKVYFANLTNLIEIHASENLLALRASPYWIIPSFHLECMELRSLELGSSLSFVA